MVFYLLRQKFDNNRDIIYIIDEGQKKWIIKAYLKK